MRKSSVLLVVLFLGLALYLPGHVHAVTSSSTCSSTADFELSVEPSSLDIVAGASGTTTVTLTPISGFFATVTLSTVNVDPNLTPVLGSPSLDLNGIPLTSSLSIMVSSSATAGSSYSLDVIATASATLSHSETVTVHVPSPAIGIVPENFLVKVATGISVVDGISLSALYGLGPTSTVSLGVSPLFTPPPLAVAPTFTVTPSVTLVGGMGMGTLTIDATTANPDYYAETVTATVGSTTTSSTSVFVTVTGPGFALSGPDHLVVPVGSSKDGTVTVKSLGGFDGTGGVMLSSIVGAPPGSLTASFAPNPVMFVAGSSTTSTLTVTALPAAIPGTYFVIVTGTSGSTSNVTYVKVTVPGPGFSIAASPDTLSTSKGGAVVTSTISLASELGFADTVDLSINCFPDGVSASITPTVMVPATGAVVTATLTVSSDSVPGTYGIDVHGMAASGPAFNDTTVMVTVTGPRGDFSLVPSATTETIVSGGSTSLSITATSLSGFVGKIDLMPAVTTGPYGLAATGLTASLVPSLTLAAGDSKSATLTLTASAVGTYYVTVTGTSGLTSHPAATITVTVTEASPPDFQPSLSSSMLSIRQGSSDTSTITISPSSGFTGDVSLSVSVNPPGPTATLGQTSISGGSGSATVTVNVPSSVAAGTYTVTVVAKGPGGTPSHSKDITVTITAVSAQPTAAAPTILGLDPTIFYSIIGGIIVVIITVTVVAVRMRRPKTTTVTG